MLILPDELGPEILWQDLTAADVVLLRLAFAKTQGELVEIQKDAVVPCQREKLELL